MEHIDIHTRMVSRSADDYARMALTGCLAVGEPACWPRWDRRSVTSFEAYFRHLTTAEPRRAARFGIRHFAWLALDPRAAGDRTLALAIRARIPDYLGQPTMVGIGETGLHRASRNELETFKDHRDLAVDHDQLLLVRTPPLEDKHRGTRLLVEELVRDGRIEPRRVLIGHVEEHTIARVLDAGFWAGIALAPPWGTPAQRVVDLVERHGAERICVVSAGEDAAGAVGAVPRLALVMRRRGHDEALIRRIVVGNPAAFLAQSPRFRLETERARVEVRAAPRVPTHPAADSDAVAAGHA